MKLTASILILLMFAMAFAPCGDSVEMDKSQQMEQVHYSNITDAENIEYGIGKHQEICSPICPCQCCPSIDSDTLDLSELSIITPIAHTMEEKISISSVFSLLIWSPPQLLS